MVKIFFKYKDKSSKEKWSSQKCIVRDIEMCKNIYGLGKDCEYMIVSVTPVKDYDNSEPTINYDKFYNKEVKDLSNALYDYCYKEVENRLVGMNLEIENYNIERIAKRLVAKSELWIDSDSVCEIVDDCISCGTYKKSDILNIVHSEINLLSFCIQEAYYRLNELGKDEKEYDIKLIGRRLYDKVELWIDFCNMDTIISECSEEVYYRVS